MATNFDIPQCANNQEGTHLCARSDTFIEREKDDAFVIRCRTCKGLNIWPKSRDENRGRYEAKMRQADLQRKQEEATRRQRTYSY
jgi:hypothetical protein